MRCRACNDIMTDYESTVRSIHTREYIGLCKHCLNTVSDQVIGVGNISLMTEMDDIGDTTMESYDEDPFADDSHNDRYYDR